LRRRVRLSTEGWYYLGIIAFVLGGAVLRDVSHLVALAGLMMAPLLLQWRIASRALRGLRIERDAPEIAVIGNDVPFRIEICKLDKRSAASSVEVLERIALAEAKADRLVRGATFAKAESLVPMVGGTPVALRWVCRFAKRGWHVLGPLRIATRAPMGLLEVAYEIPLTSRCLATPKTGTILRPWKEWSGGQSDGNGQARHRRSLDDGEFFGLREWRPGDSPRWVHWRTSARLGRLAVRQFEQSRDHQIALLLDLFTGEADPSPTLEAVAERILAFAATVAENIGFSGNTTLVIAVVGATSEYWSVRSSAASLRENMERLAVAKTGAANHWHNAVTFVAEQWMKNTKVAIVSTRSRRECRAASDPALPASWHKIAKEALWIDASNRELDPYFQWTPPDEMEELFSQTEESPKPENVSA
jgi:uncharacterized protein (DUF58 family)